MKYNKLIDHTYLKAFGTKEDIKKLCLEAKKYDFKSVCVNPANITLAKEVLKGSDVLVCTVIGFPLGANTTETKVFETKDAIAKGANEIDMVINIGKLKEKDYDYVLNEIKEIRNASLGYTLKVIIETCYLTKEEIATVSKICEVADADFVKTSTGFGTGGALAEDVKLMKESAKSKSVKASGGVKTKEDMDKMIEAGATRIGTSNGVTIMEALKDE